MFGRIAEIVELMDRERSSELKGKNPPKRKKRKLEGLRRGGASDV